MKKIVVSIFTFLVLTFMPMTVMAATNQFSVGVKDEAGDIIMFANAVLTNDDGSIEKTVNSGVGDFFDVPVGEYTLTVTADTFNDYTTTVTITEEEQQSINVVLVKKPIDPPAEKTSVMNVTIKYYTAPGSAHFGNTPDKVENYLYDLYMNAPNEINVPLEEGAYALDTMLDDGVVYQQKHLNNNGIVISVTAVKEVYNVTFYVQRQYTSRIEVLGTKYTDDTWTEFNGYTHYLSDGVNPKAETVNAVYGTDLNINPEVVEKYDLYPAYVLYYVNGSILTRTTMEEWGLSFDGTTGKITGKAPALSSNEFLMIYYYYVKSSGEVDVSYIDDEGNNIIDNVILTGKVDETYTTEEKVFEGYELSSVDGNKEGTFSTTKQDVVYNYNPLYGTVTVKYVDDYGKELASSDVFTGKYFESYKTVAKTFEGYALINTVGPTSGTYKDGNYEVIYTYQFVLGTGGDDVTVNTIPNTGIVENNTNYGMMFFIGSSLLGLLITFKKKILN